MFVKTCDKTHRGLNCPSTADVTTACAQQLGEHKLLLCLRSVTSLKPRRVREHNNTRVFRAMLNLQSRSATPLTCVHCGMLLLLHDWHVHHSFAPDRKRTSQSVPDETTFVHHSQADRQNDRTNPRNTTALGLLFRKKKKTALAWQRLAHTVLLEASGE